jgi:hypothetical protein
MSKFNVHEWNQKRRLAEINENEDPGFLGDKSGTMEALYNVIDMGKEAGLFSKLEVTALETIANNVSNKLIKRIPG